jgi:hypothetical protein
MAKKQFIDVVFDFTIWGINSNMEDYRLCLNLNKHLNWDFKRVTDIEFYSPQIKGFKIFNTYKFENVIDFYTLELIQNKKNGNILIPELKNFDFLFLLHGEDDYFEKEAFTGLLANSPGVQSVIELDINMLKSRHNLLIRHFNEQSKKKNQTSGHYWSGE